MAQQSSGGGRAAAAPAEQAAAAADQPRATPRPDRACVHALDTPQKTKATLPEAAAVRPPSPKLTAMEHATRPCARPAAHHGLHHAAAGHELVRLQLGSLGCWSVRNAVDCGGSPTRGLLQELVQGDGHQSKEGRIRLPAILPAPPTSACKQGQAFRGLTLAYGIPARYCD